MKTFNPPLPQTPTDKRAEKVAALRAVLQGKQPVSHLKEYRKRPEWEVTFWLIVYPNGHYQCTEFERCWNWDEREVVVFEPATLTVTIERFQQLEQLWRQTSNVDKRLQGGWGKDGSKYQEFQQIPTYDSILAMIGDEEEYFLMYEMDLSAETYQQYIKPFWLINEIIKRNENV